MSDPDSRGSAGGDITTLNYTLSWPYLENPSNTTFAGPTQIDICRCPRADLPLPSDDDPGHIYTRYRCKGPEVGFRTLEEGLWVLETPRGFLNMLRPASPAECQRRREISNVDDPAVYANHRLLLLTGPCPRGRYQAHATLCFLQSLSPATREHVSHLSILVQPYEEDCVGHNSKQAFMQLADYILQSLPNFKALQLFIWDEEMKVRGAAVEFGILLQKANVKISMGWNKIDGILEDYDNIKTFREDMMRHRMVEIHPVIQKDSSVEVVAMQDPNCTHNEGTCDGNQCAVKDFGSSGLTKTDDIKNSGSTSSLQERHVEDNKGES